MEKGIQNRWNKQKVSSNTVDLNLTISVNELNINGPNIPN